MRPANSIQNKIWARSDVASKIAQWRVTGNTIVFTNGCFDILHSGHISTLMEAAKEGDKLVVGINSDDSTKQLKGPGRPVNDENSRALLIASLLLVDGVIIFSEATPLELILMIQPDILIKGGDYNLDQIAGAKEVIASGGQVKIFPLVKGLSTTSIISKIHNTPIHNK